MKNVKGSLDLQSSRAHPSPYDMTKKKSPKKNLDHSNKKRKKKRLVTSSTRYSVKNKNQSHTRLKQIAIDEDISSDDPKEIEQSKIERSTHFENPNLVINVKKCKYSAIPRIAFDKFGWDVRGKKENWDIMWADAPISQKVFLGLKSHQKIN